MKCNTWEVGAAECRRKQPPKGVCFCQTVAGAYKVQKKVMLTGNDERVLTPGWTCGEYTALALDFGDLAEAVEGLADD